MLREVIYSNLLLKIFAVTKLKDAQAFRAWLVAMRCEARQLVGRSFRLALGLV